MASSDAGLLELADDNSSGLLRLQRGLSATPLAFRLPRKAFPWGALVPSAWAGAMTAVCLKNFKAKSDRLRDRTDDCFSRRSYKGVIRQNSMAVKTQHHRDVGNKDMHCSDPFAGHIQYLMMRNCILSGATGNEDAHKRIVYLKVISLAACIARRTGFIHLLANEPKRIHIRLFSSYLDGTSTTIWLGSSTVVPSERAAFRRVSIF